MAKKISTYLVAMGCIQEGAQVYLEGQEYTPPTAALEQELLEAGVISGPVTPSKKPAAASSAKAGAATGVAEGSGEDAGGPGADGEGAEGGEGGDGADGADLLGQGS